METECEDLERGALRVEQRLVCLYVLGAPFRDEEHRRRSGFGRWDDGANLGYAGLEIWKGYERACSQEQLNLKIRNSSKIPDFVVDTGWRQSLRESEQSQERKGMG